MKKTTFRRFLALVLAMCFIAGGALTVGAATGMNGSVTNKTLSEIKEQLNAMPYEEYHEKFVAQGIPRATQEMVINALDYAETSEGLSVVEIPEQNALYTPGEGSIVWEVSIPTTARYSMILEYWPDEAKSAPVERILKINDVVPFSEARFLTLPKVWKNKYSVATVSDPKGKISADALYDGAIAAGFSAEAVEKAEDGSCIYIEMPSVWTQSIADYVNNHTVRFLTTDIDDNEIRPSMVQAPEWNSYELRDADGFYAESFEFVLEAGTQKISLEAVNEPMTLRAIRLVPHKDLVTYEEYSSKYEGIASGSDWIRIQAEYTDATSSQTIYPLEDRTDAATMPSDTNRTLLNTIGGEKWQTAGQWVRYTFKVNTSGMYNIATRYRQNTLDGMYTCRAIYLTSNGAAEGSLGYYDGVIPFAEAAHARFNYGSEWQSTLLNDGEGNNFEFYFEAGVEYTLQLEVTLGSMGDIVRRVDAALTAINKDYLAIMKLTGASPDKYREYGFSRSMPDTMIDMIIQSRELYAVAEELSAVSGDKGSNAATLEKVAWLLERMGSNEDEIAKYLDQLKSYIGSLGTWLGSAKTQPLQLDYLVVQPLGSELPEAKAGFFASLAHEVKSFFMSFFRNYNRMGATTEEAASEDALEVWLAYGRDQAQVIRNLITNDFTPATADRDYEIPVNLKLVAAGTLLPSVLAGMGPDVYIGVSEDNVINYAIRGALVPVEDMSGFADFALYYKVDEHFNTIYDADGNPIRNPNAQFNEAAMLVLGIADAENNFHYYGLPETQNFTMMFVRDDILADLNIEIPKTWDDILAAIPILQANNMQIGMHTDYKVFLYQMGGELFADDGMRINLDSNTGLESFETMCNFFTMYSFPYKYDFANRFRTGEMPIGFASYNGTYNQLTVFATEIKGLWEFLPMPGIEHTIENPDGTTETYINNVSVSTVSAICIMTGCKNEEHAWEFMKWHVGADCQKKYSNEMVAIIGPSAKHATANITALREMPWTTEEYTQLQYQFNNLASIPNYPGSYIISRYTKFAFLAAYEDNANPVDKLESYITIINKEITRKREEFGLETLRLGQTLKQKRLEQVMDAYQSDVKKIGESKVENISGINLMEDLIRLIERENYDNVDAVSLQKAGEILSAADADGFSATIAAINAAVSVLGKDA